MLLLLNEKTFISITETASLQNLKCFLLKCASLYLNPTDCINNNGDVASRKIFFVHILYLYYCRTHPWFCCMCLGIMIFTKLQTRKVNNFYDKEFKVNNFYKELSWYFSWQHDYQCIFTDKKIIINVSFRKEWLSQDFHVCFAFMKFVPSWDPVLLWWMIFIIPPYWVTRILSNEWDVTAILDPPIHGKLQWNHWNDAWIILGHV